MGSSKTTMWIIITITSALFGYIPTLWGADPFGFESIFGGLIGGFFGIWVWYKFVR